MARRLESPVRGGLAQSSSATGSTRVGSVPPSTGAAIDEGGDFAKVVLRQGRARPLWFGHPWVYANGVDARRGRPGPGRRGGALRSRRPVHRPGLLQPALADPGAALHPRRRPVDAGFFRARIARARAARARLGLPSERDQRLPPGQQRGGRPAGAGGRRLRRRRGRADHHAGDLAPGATRSSTRWRRSSASKTIFEISPASYAELEGFAAGSRVARGEQRTRVDGRRGRHHAGGRAALRTEDGDVHRPARDPRPRRRAGQAARACSISTPTPAASRWPPRAAAPRR